MNNTIRNISFIGAGNVAETLSRAMISNGILVSLIASRDRSSASRLAALLPSCESANIQDAIDASEVIFVTVPDDVIELVAKSYKWHPGQLVIHCSGGAELNALSRAKDDGANIGGFHPMQICSNPLLAAKSLPGCAVAIEANMAAREVLHELAKNLQLNPIDIPIGARAAYHAGANLAASLLLITLREAIQLWISVGFQENVALDALLPLARRSLETAELVGLDEALSGPIRRGDAGMVLKHLHAISTTRSKTVELYKLLGHFQWMETRSENMPHRSKDAMSVLLHG